MKPTTIRARERERIAWEMRQKFATEIEIANAIGISQPAVSKMLRRLHERWSRENLEMISEKKAEQISQLEYIARQSIDAWDDSKKPSRTTTEKRNTASIPLDGDSIESDISNIQVQQKEQYGDPRYLQVAITCLSDMRKIYGLDKIKPITSMQIDFSQLTDDQLDRIAAGEDPLDVLRTSSSAS